LRVARFDITRLPGEAKLVALALNPPMRRDALARDQTRHALQSRANLRLNVRQEY
jgi:hypothetical protein